MFIGIALVEMIWKECYLTYDFAEKIDVTLLTMDDYYDFIKTIRKN